MAAWESLSAQLSVSDWLYTAELSDSLYILPLLDLFFFLSLVRSEFNACQSGCQGGQGDTTLPLQCSVATLCQALAPQQADPVVVASQGCPKPQFWCITDLR